MISMFRTSVISVIRASALAVAMAALATSGYAASTPPVIHVDDDAAAGGDGSASLPFNTLVDALSAANGISGSVVIDVAPGVYRFDHSLVIQRPLELRGSSAPVFGPDGLPTGDVVPGTETRLVGTDALGTDSLGSDPLISVGRTDGVVISGVTISGFILAATTASNEVLLTRVQNYSIRNNVFLPPGNFGMHSIASSGVVTGNFFTGISTGAIFSGGYAASPSNVVFQGNRAVKNILGGVLLNGASLGIPELGDRLVANVQNNDLSGNIGSPGFSFGIRIFILRRDLGLPGDTQSEGNVHASVTGNRIVGNEMGFSIDAGFPYRKVQTPRGPVCDARVYSGSVDLSLSGNTVASSHVTPALITFTRSTSAVNPSTLPLWQYLHGATFTIADPDNALANALIDHPDTDPLVGPCPADATHENLSNLLRYNGQVLPHGRNF
jgi:hypothetical protein